jgi:hypothetical protein
VHRRCPARPLQPLVSQPLGTVRRHRSQLSPATWVTVAHPWRPPRGCPRAWRHTSPMDQNTQFSAASRRDRLARTQLWALDVIRRQTGDQGGNRSLTHGPQGLEARSRSSPPTASRDAPAAPMGACGGTITGATAHTSAAEPMSASRHRPWHRAGLRRPPHTRAVVRPASAHRRGLGERETTPVTVTHVSGPYCDLSPRPVNQPLEAWGNGSCHLSPRVRWLTALPRTHRLRCLPVPARCLPDRGHDLFNGLAPVSPSG